MTAKANLWINYISDQDNTRGGRTTGSGPVDYILVSVNACSSSEKVGLWHIPHIYVIY